MRMVEVFEQVNLDLQGSVETFWEFGESNLFDGDGLAGTPIECAVDASKGALTKTITELLGCGQGSTLTCVDRNGPT